MAAVSDQQKEVREKVENGLKSPIDWGRLGQIYTTLGQGGETHTNAVRGRMARRQERREDVTNDRAEDLVRARIRQAYTDEGLTPPRGGGAGGPDEYRGLEEGDTNIPLRDRIVMGVLPRNLRDRYVNMRVRQRSQGTRIGNLVRAPFLGWHNRYGGLRGSQRRLEHTVDVNGGPPGARNDFGQAAEDYLNAEHNFHQTVDNARNGPYVVNVAGVATNLNGPQAERMLGQVGPQFQNIQTTVTGLLRARRPVPAIMQNQYTQLTQTLNDLTTAVNTYRGTLEDAEADFRDVYQRTAAAMEHANPAAYMQFLGRFREVIRRTDRVHAYTERP